MKASNIALAVVAGFAAGAILGVLFAPDKGSATRKKLVKTGQKYADDLTETFNEFVESITEQFEALQEEASHVAEEIKSKAKNARSEVT
jgi:gas vesicle protein